jgi:hypothetical protein
MQNHEINQKNQSMSGEILTGAIVSVTPVGYFTGAKSLPWVWSVHRDYFAWHKLRYFTFRATEMIIPRLPLHLMEFEGIYGGNICNIGCE